jgi:DNA invertase Pin-like site-specific DNA recombinase
MSGKHIGYVRVSTFDQNTERQLDGVHLDKTFTDKASGKDTNRPQLKAALDYIREGDTLVVHSLDRLARNVEDLRRMVRELTEKGVTVQFIKENLTFNGGDSPMSNLMLTMLGAFAEFERSLIRERQREGIAIAKAKGTYSTNRKGGRKEKLDDAAVALLRSRVASGDMKAVIARELGISRATLYAYLTK